MLGLGDFFQHPLVPALLEKLFETRSGLLVVSGPEGYSLTRGNEENSAGRGILPSGRRMIFFTILENLLRARNGGSCIFITSAPDEIRRERSLKRLVHVIPVENELQYGERIAQAVAKNPGLLVIDNLTEQSASMALSAAQQGLCVLTQLDSVLSGPAIKRHILKLGVAPERINSLRWAVCVQRVPMLCPNCRQPLPLSGRLYDRLQDAIRQFPDSLAFIQNPAFYTAGSCDDCQQTGRKGDIAICDIYQRGDFDQLPWEENSLLPARSYLAYLAVRGTIAVQDWLDFDTNQTLNLFELFKQRDQALAHISAQQEAKILELTAAHRVVEQRTHALVSLQTIAQTLLQATDLDKLAAQVCRQVCELCHAERAVLYYRRSPDEIELLAASGWPAPIQEGRVEVKLLPGFQGGMQAYPYRQAPPGIHFSPSEGAIKAGLCVPLIAQGEPVGWVMIHSLSKAAFLPGEIALLQTFASQASIALQRAGLVVQLKAKIRALEAAQRELAQKERIERELELARQVQQSVLPTSFPTVEGYLFSALNSPARQVGGDFYDVLSLDETHLGITIADVSDKGLPAALFMTLTRSLLLAEARRAHSPAAVLNNVNEVLLELGKANMFVTLFYGVLDCTTRKLSYVRAGHDRPLLLRDGTITELDGKGIPLGLFGPEFFQLSEEQIQLQAGDWVVLYTDGLVDVENPQRVLYSRPLFIELIASQTGLHPEAFCQGVFSALRTYQQDAEQADDMTMLVMEVT